MVCYTAVSNPDSIEMSEAYQKISDLKYTLENNGFLAFQRAQIAVKQAKAVGSLG